MINLISNVQVNPVAVILAGMAAMAIGFLWYSPALFGKTWMQLSGLGEARLAEKQKESMTVTYVFAFGISLIMAFALAVLVSKAGIETFRGGLWLALLVWGGFVATVEFGGVLWAEKPIQLFIINAAHYLVSLIAMTLIIVCMRGA